MHGCVCTMVIRHFIKTQSAKLGATLHLHAMQRSAEDGIWSVVALLVIDEMS